MTYPLTWSIPSLERVTSTGIVYIAHYNVVATSDDGFTASSYGSIGLPAPDPSTTVPYQDITQDMAIGWVKNTLGQEQVTAITVALSSTIDEQRHPTHAQGVPWNNTVPALNP